MSCIAGSLLRGGPTADRTTMERMLATMHSRAPDGDSVALVGAAALGQSFLRTGTSSAEQQNRLTLDGQVWVVADARIDGRADLVRHLRRAGRDASLDTPHGELILHAYHAFGDNLLEHLLGDFAFALWDQRAAKLLCARDPFGVRPLYYWASGGDIAFASDISALRTLPRVSCELDHVAVADFLALGMCIDADATIYRDIRCLPPASRLDASPGNSSISRYWELPLPAETRFRKRADYVDRFNELFRQAVEDRTPQGPVAIPLSAGLDSSSIAVVARAARPECTASAYHVSAHALVQGDDEAPCARQVAAQLGMGFVQQELGDYELFARSGDPAMRTAFPSPSPLLAVHGDMGDLMSRRGERVLLSGYSGDAVMAPSIRYYSGLIHRGRMLKLAGEIGHHFVHTRSLRGMSLRTALRSKAAAPAWKPAFPDWIAPALSAEVDLAHRWGNWWEAHEAATDAVAQLRVPWLQRQFEAIEVLPRPFVARYPFLDLRLVGYLLGLPNFMLTDKAILRDAMRGRLPESVRTRPKRGAAGDPVRKLVTNSKLDSALFAQDEDLSRFVVPEAFIAARRRYLEGEGSDSTWANWLILQPVAFAIWLRSNRSYSNARS